jgi:hypothetical protein
VKGAKGIGPKGAVELLKKHKSLEALYADIHEIGHQDLGIKPSTALALDEFETRYPTVRTLIALRDDVSIPFSEVMTERVPKDAATFGLEERIEEEMDTLVKETLESAADVDALGVLREANGVPLETISPPTETNGANGETKAPVRETAAPATLAVREDHVIDAEPVAFERQLEPRSMKEAQALSTNLYASRLFSAYGTPAAVLTVILAGRELGFQALASLRAFHIIEGKPTLSADGIRSLVIKSGCAKFFRCTERTAEKATFETQRGDDPPTSLSYTIAEAQASGRVKPNSGYAKDPADLLVARASAKLARLVYADVVHGMYAHEEID